MTLWLCAVAALMAVWLTVRLRRGPTDALGAAVLASALVPSWVAIDVAGVELRVHLAVAGLAVLFYLFDPRGRVRTGLVATDYAGLCLLAAHVTADVSAGEQPWFPMLRSYAEWALPYIVGRLAFKRENVGWLVWFGAAVAAVTGLLALVEAFGFVNPYELPFGERPELNVPRDLTRWGFKRAYGPTEHPNYFGGMQLVLLPFAAAAAAGVGWGTEAGGRGKGLGRAALALCLAGLCAPISRAPMLAAGVAAAFLLLHFAPKARRVAFYAAAAGLIGVTVAAGTVGGELVPDRAATTHYTLLVPVDGHAVPFDGELSRIYTAYIFRRAMERRPLLGYGTASVSGFPIKVPAGPDGEETLRFLNYIDQTYLLMQLRMGLCGLLAFLALGVFAHAAFVSSAFASAGAGAYGGAGAFGHRVFEAAGAGVLAGVGLLLFTVWLPFEIEYWLLILCGASTAARRARRPPPRDFWIAAAKAAALALLTGLAWLAVARATFHEAIAVGVHEQRLRDRDPVRADKAARFYYRGRPDELERLDAERRGRLEAERDAERERNNPGRRGDVLERLNLD